jgi:hypothetical protein
VLGSERQVRREPYGWEWQFSRIPKDISRPGESQGLLFAGRTLFCGAIYSVGGVSEGDLGSAGYGRRRRRLLQRVSVRIVRKEETMLKTMLKEMRELTAGAWALHPAWRIWMAALVVVNGVAPLFFLPRLTAVVTLVASFTAFLLALVLIRLHGYSKLLGVMHAPWVPMLAASIYLYPAADAMSLYKAWLAASILLTIGSLVIDVTDVCRFLKAQASPG